MKGKGFLAFEKEEKRWSLFSLEFVLSDVAPVTAVAILGYWSEGDVHKGQRQENCGDRDLEPRMLCLEPPKLWIPYGG